MKKLITICIALCYFVVSSGMVVHVQYCMGKISAVKSADSTPKKKCGCSKKAKPKKCCTFETKLLKAASHYSSNKDKVDFSPKYDDKNSAETNLLADFFTTYSLSNSLLLYNSPPQINTQPLYILHAVFLI
jgi:hypothetical protein